MFAATADDPALHRTPGNVVHTLRPPTDLFPPATMLRVLRARLGATRPRRRSTT